MTTAPDPSELFHILCHMHSVTSVNCFKNGFKITSVPNRCGVKDFMFLLKSLQLVEMTVYPLMSVMKITYGDN